MAASGQVVPRSPSPCASGHAAPVPRPGAGWRLKGCLASAGPSAQSLMKAIGEVQVVGGAHFVGAAGLAGLSR